MEEKQRLLKVSSSPHVFSGNRIDTAMRDVFIALLPAIAFSTYFFGLRALVLTAVTVVAAVAAEYVSLKVRKAPMVIDDWSAALTGLLLAMLLPSTLPYWMAVIGAAAAIVLGKQVFGGLGNNLFNPALIGRAVVGISWPVAMGNWVSPFDAVSTATPLGILLQLKHSAELSPKEIAVLIRSLPSLWELFIGSVAGSLGEVSALALIIGGIYLLYRKHIGWRIPIIYMATVFVLSMVFNRGFPPLWFGFFNLFSGGLILGAFFMATDWVTSPMTKKGHLVFAFGLGILTFLIRNGGVYPEGVLYSILIMNMFTPLIDRFTRQRVFGKVKVEKNG